MDGLYLCVKTLFPGLSVAKRARLTAADTAQGPALRADSGMADLADWIARRTESAAPWRAAWRARLLRLADRVWLEKCLNTPGEVFVPGDGGRKPSGRVVY